MERNDEFIHGLYRASLEEEWRDYRASALARVCAYFGGASASWWTRGRGVEGGELTEYPRPLKGMTALAAMKLPGARGETLIEMQVAGEVVVAFYHEHYDAAIVSTVLLSYAAGCERPSAERMRRVVGHMIEAGALSLRQFISRDDWLASMGRSNRGSAAMVDARGSVFSASARFREMIDGDPASISAKLPFALPKAVLGDDGGEFVHGPLHLRVRRCGQLYLMYARKPLALDSLSPREQEIARSLGEGKTLKSIARQYGIAVSTVANHTTRIYKKLAIYRREDLIELVRARPEAGRKAG